MGVGERERRSRGPKNEIPAWGIIFGAASCENTILGCPATFREPYGKGGTYFIKLLAKIKNRMDFLHVGRALYIFSHLIYFLAPRSVNFA